MFLGLLNQQIQLEFQSPECFVVGWHDLCVIRRIWWECLMRGSKQPLLSLLQFVCFYDAHQHECNMMPFDEHRGMCL